MLEVTVGVHPLPHQHRDKGQEQAVASRLRTGSHWQGVFCYDVTHCSCIHSGKWAPGMSLLYRTLNKSTQGFRPREKVTQSQTGTGYRHFRGPRDAEDIFPRPPILRPMPRHILTVALHPPSICTASFPDTPLSSFPVCPSHIDPRSLVTERQPYRPSSHHRCDYYPQRRPQQSPELVTARGSGGGGGREGA